MVMTRKYLQRSSEVDAMYVIKDNFEDDCLGVGSSQKKSHHCSF